MLKKPKTHKGFSIVEIVIAILIISVLAVAVFAGGSTVVRNATKSKTQSDLHNFAVATETWMNNNPSIAKAKNNSKYKLDTTLYNKFNELLDDDYKLEPVSGDSMVEITQDAEDTGDYYIFQSRKTDAWDKPYYVVFSNQNRNNLTGEKHSEFYVEVISAGANGKAIIGGSSDVIDKDDIFLVGQYDNDTVISHIFTYEDEQPGNYLAAMATSYTNIETAPTNIGVVRIKGSPTTNAPTPDGPGSGIACPACGTIYASETDAPAHSINNSAASNAASWKAAGNSCIRTCDGCGKTLTTGFHSYGNYTAGNPKTDATHTLSRTCSKCDYIDTSLENHTFNSGTIVGNNRVFTCTKCGYVKTVENSATCPVCSTVYSSSSAAPAGSINYSATSTTWSDNGSTCREICGGCGKSLSTSSHTYGPSSIGNPKTETYHTIIRICTRCGHNDSTTENHTFDNGVISGNNIAYTCTQCGYIKNVAITAPTAKALTYNGTTNDNGTPQILLNAGTVTDGTIQYSLTNNSDWSTTIPTGTNAGSYTVYYRVIYNDKTTAAQSINVTIARKGIARVTGTTISFTYDGSVKTVVVNGYDSNALTRDGTYSATDVGNYTATYTPKSNFKWNNGSNTTSAISINWSIGYGIEKITDTNIPAGSVFSFGTMSVTKDGVTTALTMPTNPVNDGDFYSYTTSAKTNNIKDYYNATSITFGDSVDGKKLNWVKASDTLYICDRNLWNYISYEDLDTLGYGETDNTVVTIDGQTFKVRLLGGTYRTDEEWDKYIVNGPDDFDGTWDNSDTKWHWSTCFSWTNTISGSNRVLRGGNSLESTAYSSGENRYGNGGFRPALELVKIDPTYTAPTAKALTYNGTINTNGTAQALINAGSATGGTMQYSTDNTNWSTEIPTGTNAGSYTVYYRVVGDTNHNDVAAQSINVTIARKGISRVTGTTTSFTYDGSAKTVVVSGYDENTITRGGTASATNAGNYTAAYTPKSNFQWATGSDVTEATFVAWTISKAAPTYTAPTAKALTYNGTTNTNGTAQALVTAGSAIGGTMQYSADNSNWSTEIPAGTNAGSYTVYYRVVGDANHNDVAAKSINVTIARKGISRVTGTTTSFTYDGNTKEVVVNGYDANTITRGGTYSATEPGNYTATYTPKSNFRWNSGSNTTSAISIDWEIEQQIFGIESITDTSVPAGSVFSFGTMYATKDEVTTALTMPTNPAWGGDLYSYSGSSSGNNVTTYSNPTSITFGNSEDGKKLNWVKASDTLYICDRNLWNYISYDDLDALGYGETDNTLVTIDGQTFKVRLLTSDEWTSYVQPNSTNGSPYYLENCFSWTSTLYGDEYSSFCEVLGIGYRDSETSDRYEDIGFRPALELIPNALKFSSPEAFTLVTGNSAKNWDGTLEYSTDLSNWTEWNGAETQSTNVLYIRGTNNTKLTGNNSNYRWILTNTNNAGISCAGNIENLIDYTVVAAGNHPTINSYEFAYLFCNCTSLTTAPELPATTLAEECYRGMFQGCTSLTTAPVLPADTLAAYCYYEMFKGCTGLTTAPALNATTLANGCYYSMFFDCTSLNTVPELPATTLVYSCYQYMFYGCTSLKLSTKQNSYYVTPYRIPKEGTGTTASNDLSSMFYNTGGSFTGTPSINKTYYLHSSNSVV